MSIIKHKKRIDAPAPKLPFIISLDEELGKKLLAPYYFVQYGKVGDIYLGPPMPCYQKPPPKKYTMKKATILSRINAGGGVFTSTRYYPNLKVVEKEKRAGKRRTVTKWDLH